MLLRGAPHQVRTVHARRSMSAYAKAAVLTVRVVKKKIQTPSMIVETPNEMSAPGVIRINAYLSKPLAPSTPSTPSTQRIANTQIAIAMGLIPSAFRRYPYAIFSSNRIENLARSRVCSISQRVPAA